MKKVLFCAILLIAVIAGMAVIRQAAKKEPAPRVIPAAAEVVPILIIDAGHGGADGGAVSDNGARESEINLDIAKKLDLLAAFFGVRTIMTRDSESITYSPNAKTIHDKKVEDIKNRVNLINSISPAVLISIHQNKYTSPGPFGAQTLYAKTAGSKELAEHLQKTLIDSLNKENYRAAAQIQSNIYLMNKVNCPAVLIECGFLSNPSEDALLQTGEYRLKVAAAILAGYLGSAA